MKNSYRSFLTKFISKNHFCIYLLFLLLLATSCSAQQVVLTRIASAERSDGKGYVVRFHVESSVSSFSMAQPVPNLIQLALHDPYIDTKGIIQSLSPIFEVVALHQIEDGVGIILKIKSDDFYRAQAYPDGGSDDILLALTQTSKAKLLQQIDTEKPLAWAPKPEPATNIEPATPETPNITRTSYQKLKEKLQIDTIVLDAGHGGHDVGAIGYSGQYEKEIVFEITQKVGHYINKYMPEVEVVYTRTGDYYVGEKKHPGISHMQSLIERGQIANRANGDLFISIHANAAASSQAHGTEVYFLGLERSQTALEVMKRENNIVDLKKSEKKHKITSQEMFIYKLANSANIAASQKLAGMISNQFQTRANRNSRGVKQARFVVLYHASMPAVLVETGFVTNPEEEDFLTSEHGQSIIASAIFRAIRNYRQQFGVAQK